MIELNSTIKKYKILFTNLIIFFMVYGAWIINKHFASDTYNVYYYGMTEINLTNGRVVHWLIYKMLECIRFPIWKNLYITQISLLIAISYISFRTYNYFIKFVKYTLVTSIVVDLISILMFANISYAEGWFYFPETCFGAAISTTATYLAIFSFFDYVDKNSICFLIKSFALFVVALNMYQIYIEVYLVLCCIYILCKSRGKLTLKEVRYALICILLAGIASIITILILKLCQSLGVAAMTDRSGSLTVKIFINNLATTIRQQYLIWNNFNGFLSKYGMLSISIIDILCIITIIRYFNNKLLIIAALLGMYLCIFAPTLITTNISFVPRIIYGFFIFTYGIIYIYLSIDYSNNILNYVMWFFLALSTFGMYNSIQNMIVDNIAVNRLDQEECLSIQRKIDEYQAQSQYAITQICFCNDDSKRWGYDSIQYCLYDTNIRALAVTWADINVLNYYTGHNYEKIESDSVIKAKIFGDYNASEFDIDEQVKFSHNIAYVLVY